MSGARGSGRLVAWLVAACYFMELMDATIVVTSAPRLQAALHISSSSVGLLMAAYLITAAVTIPFGGWLAHRIGPRRTFLIAITLFTGFSFACGASSSFSWLMTFRVLQATGAAMMVPVGRIMVLRRVEKSDLMRVLAYIIWPGLLAPALAPVLGGVLVTYLSWRWLFWINVPLGVLALVSSAVLIGPEHAERTRRPFDWWGMTATTAGLVSILWAAYVSGEAGSSWSLPAALALLGAVVLAMAVRHLRRLESPYLELRVLRIRALRDALRGYAVFVVVVGAVPLLLPLMLQEHLNWSPVASGEVLLALFAGNVLVKPLTTPLLRRVRHRVVLALSAVLLVATLVVFALLSGATSTGLVFVVAFISGMARSVGFTTYFTLFYADVPEALMNAATTLVVTTQQVFAGLALSFGIVVLRLGADLASAPMTSGVAFRYAFGALALLGVVVALISRLMEVDAGHAVRGVRTA